MRDDDPIHVEPDEYRVLFDSTLDAITVMEGQVFANCNPAALALFGCTRDQLVGSTPAHFSPPTQPDGEGSDAKARRLVGLAYEGLSQLFEWRHRRLDGATFDCEVHLNRVGPVGSRRLVAVIRDRTELSAASKALVAKEAQQALVLRSVPLVFYTAYTNEDYGGTWVSPQIVDLSGFSAEQFVESRELWASRIHPDDAERVMEAFEGLAESGSLRIEYRWQRADGTWAWFRDHSLLTRDHESSPLELVGTWRDVTKRRQAEEAARVRGDFQALLAHNSTRLLSVEPAAMDQTMGEVLRDVAQFFGRERALVVVFDGERQTGRIAYEWSSEGLPSRLEWPEPSFEEASAIIDTLLADTPFGANISELEQVPAMLQRLHAEGTRSLVAVPINVSGRVAGALSLESVGREVEWCDEAMERLSTVGGVLGIAMERHKAELRAQSYCRDLRTLASHLSVAEERERRRIAVGLHDSAAQVLALAMLRLRRLSKSHAHVAEELDEIHDLIKQTANELRSLSFDLSPPTLHEVGLGAALDVTLERFAEQHGLERTFSDDGGSHQMGDDIRTLTYRCVTELLANVAKHAQARSVSVELILDGPDLVVVVADDGKGFGVGDSVPVGCAGLGLFSIRERLRAVGGRMEIETGTASGARVMLIVPAGETAADLGDGCW